MEIAESLVKKVKIVIYSNPNPFNNKNTIFKCKNHSKDESLFCSFQIESSEIRQRHLPVPEGH